MNASEIKLQLRDILTNRMDLELDGEVPTDSDNFFDVWGIDSVDVLDLVLAIEQDFGLKIKPNDDGVKEYFDSIDTLSTYIEKQREVESA